MRIGVPKEQLVNEKRVSITPKSVKQLLQLGFNIVIEKNAGEKAGFDDEMYKLAGAVIMDRDEIWKSDVVLKVNAPEENEIAFLCIGTILICFIWASQNPHLLEKLADRGATVMAMDSVPRISRAQPLDALSSMSNILGYRAIIEAAYEFEQFFTGQITAAGKISPAKVLVIGAGVAGLSAIGIANRLGAVVRVYDSRKEVKEEVISMGAEFLEVNFQEELGRKDGYSMVKSKEFVKSEIELLSAQVKEVDIIISTALTSGKPAPKLITRKMVSSMKSGSIIVDLAVQNGGNCECTVNNKIVKTNNNIKIIGYDNLLILSRLPMQSSQLYSSNLVNLLKLLCKNKDGKVIVDFNDIIVRSITLVYEGKILYPKKLTQVQESNKLHKKENEKIEEIRLLKKEKKSSLLWGRYMFLLMMFALILFSCLVSITTKEFLNHLTVFMLSCVVGYYIVWNVSHALHTPLMSVTNAISGIIIIGAISQISYGGIVSFLSFIAILVTSINIFGGFIITQRMLKMFRKDLKVTKCLKD